MVSLKGLAQTSLTKDTSTYFLKARLVETVSLPPGCGGFAFALAQKFEIIRSEIPGYSSGILVIIQPCPDIWAKSFFKKGEAYIISAARNNDAPFDYIVSNKYEKEKLPTFWSREIKLDKQ